MCLSIFQTCEASFSKSRTDTNIMFSLKVAQDPRLPFHRKKFSKKFGFMVFFSKKFLKNAISDNFLISYISELKPNTMSMVSYIVQAFYRLHFGLQKTSKFFFILGVFGQKRGQQFFRKNFSHSKLIFLKTNKRYRNCSLSRKTA